MKLTAIAALLMISGLPANASIALFTDGRSMKISGFRLVDQNAIQLTFKNGGAMTMPLNRIKSSRKASFRGAPGATTPRVGRSFGQSTIA